MKSVLKIHKGTRRVAGAFPSAAQAARETGSNSKSMRQACLKGYLPEGPYYYRFAEDFDPDEDFTGKSRVPVVIKDKKTGELRWHPSAACCAESLGVTVKCVYEAAAGVKNIVWRWEASYAPKPLPREMAQALFSEEHENEPKEQRPCRAERGTGRKRQV